MTGRFGPVDAHDLVGDASARLLTLGLERRQRLTALRLLGLIADHAGADRRVRRHVDDLAAEFAISAPELDTSLAALVMAEVIQLDLDHGGVRLVVPAPPVTGGLRLDGFLANVARSLDATPADRLAGTGHAGMDHAGTEHASVEDAPATSGSPRAAARPAALGADATTPSPAEVGAGPAPATRARAGDRVDEVTSPTSHADHDMPVGTTSTDVHAEHDIPVALTGLTPRAHHRRSLRTATATLVAAVAALLLAVSPNADQSATTGAAERAVADSPIGGRRPATTGAERPSAGTAAPTTDGATSPGGEDVTTGATEEVAGGGIVAGSPREGGASTTPAGPADLSPTATPELDPVEEPDPLPTPGPEIDMPCTPDAPKLDVTGVTTVISDGTGPEHVAGSRAALVGGTVTNPRHRAVVIQAFLVEVVLRDGTTTTARTAAPMALGAHETTSWLVTVPLPASEALVATATVEKWTDADGGPLPCAEEAAPPGGGATRPEERP